MELLRNIIQITTAMDKALPEADFNFWIKEIIEVRRVEQPYDPEKEEQRNKKDEVKKIVNEFEKLLIDSLKDVVETTINKLTKNNK